MPNFDRCYSLVVAYAVLNSGHGLCGVGGLYRVELHHFVRPSNYQIRESRHELKTGGFDLLLPSIQIGVLQLPSMRAESGVSLSRHGGSFCTADPSARVTNLRSDWQLTGLRIMTRDQSICEVSARVIDLVLRRAIK